ncbi:MAG: plastocyanin/azurin family copper-binding protein [Solirubrobacteraceae bacterium]
MHTAVQLALVLAAGKSKLPFYLAGGVLVAWALAVSMAIGMRRESFPKNEGQQRAIMAVSAILVLLAVSMAVVTSGGEGRAAAAGTKSQPAAEVSPQPAPSSSSQSTSTPAPAASQPTATTGTPAPASSPAAGTGSKLALAADPSGQLAFDKKSLSAKAGKVEISFANASPVEHNVTIAQGSTVLGQTPTFAGGAKTLSLSLKPGTYTFFCSVPGHRPAGMEGTLTVTA